LHGLNAAPHLLLPAVGRHTKPVWHLFVVRHKQRDRLQALLQEAGVQTLIHYPIPPHLQDAYNSQSFGSLLVAEQLAKEVLSLPMGPHLSDAEVEYTIEQVIDACKRLAGQRAVQ